MNEIQQNNLTDETYHKEPKQNYVIYTIISILLFAVLYAGFQFGKNMLFRDYIIDVKGTDLTAEQLAVVNNEVEMDFSEPEQLRFVRENNIFSVEILYNAGVYTDFAEDYENYVEDDSNDGHRLEIYPYGNSVSEYVYARYFVNADFPDRACYLYEYNGDNYILFSLTNVSQEIKAVFVDFDKIYSE